jgi:hypothetical protein
MPDEARPVQLNLTSSRQNTAEETQPMPELPVELHLQILQHRAREMSGHELLHLEQTLYGQDGAPELWAHVATPFLETLREHAPDFSMKMSQIVREGLPTEVLQKLPERCILDLAAAVHVLGIDTAIFKQLMVPRALAQGIASAHQNGLLSLMAGSSEVDAALRGSRDRLRDILAQLEHRPDSELGSRMRQVGRAVLRELNGIEAHLVALHADPVGFEDEHNLYMMTMQRTSHAVRDIVAAAASAPTF